MHISWIIRDNGCALKRFLIVFPIFLCIYLRTMGYKRIMKMKLYVVWWPFSSIKLKKQVRLISLEKMNKYTPLKRILYKFYLITDEHRYGLPYPITLIRNKSIKCTLNLLKQHESVFFLCVIGMLQVEASIFSNEVTEKLRYIGLIRRLKAIFNLHWGKMQTVYAFLSLNHRQQTYSLWSCRRCLLGNHI